ncbi:hypothetical protein SUGI_1105720 [Cryptomeria japonica]|nr:hypothetical protein SUGI_1105720 [Cryptomeria japonica]
MAMNYLLLAISMIITLNNCTSSALHGGDTLLMGGSLAGNQTITSKNGTFTLGFFSPRGTSNWYVGIWYARMSPKVTVWVANRDNPVRSVPGVLKFSSEGRLRLFDREGRSVWSTDVGLKGSWAMITDPGNFIMLGHGHNKSEIVWESFAHPGDTWLPGMKMWKGMKLTSWKSSVDPAIGLFSFEMDKSPGKTDMVLVYNNSVTYWSSGEWTGSYFANIPEGEAYTQKIFIFSFVRVSPSRINYQFRVITWGHILTGRVVLNEKGELKIYLWMDDDAWNEAWSSHRGQCSEHDICGAYGLCNLNDVCSCIEGFIPKQYTQGLLSSGCARRRTLHCSITAGTTDGFLESKNRNLPEEGAVSYNNESTLQGCRTVCLNNCSCTAFSFVISDLPVCRLWFGDLFIMRVSSDNQSIFIRLAVSELPPSMSSRSDKTPVVLIVLLSVVAFLVVSSLLFGAFLMWKRRRLRKKGLEEDVPISLKIDFSRVLTTTRGTRGYLAPEWISGLPITSKVDVYSFGMTLLEILSGRRNLDLKVEKSRLYFPTWALSQIGGGNIIGVVDVRIASEANIEEVRRAAVVAGLCIQDDENRRPSMGEVVRILEGTMEAPVPEIPRSLQVLVDQVEDDETAQTPGMLLSSSMPT